MSSKKITDADKLEIVDLYRQSGETTASLASRYGVSNSTISRLLKNSIPEAEYEVLIQQKRGSKANSDEESASSDMPTTAVPQLPLTLAIESQPEPEEVFAPEIDRTEPVIDTIKTDDRDLAEPPAISSESEREPISTPASMSAEERAANQRRVRRRPSAPVTIASEEPIATASQSATIANIDVPPNIADLVAAEVATSDDRDPIAPVPTKTIVPPPTSRTPVLRDILADSKDRYSPPPATIAVAETASDDNEEDGEEEDVNALAAMFGEEIADGEDDDDDDDDDSEESTSSTYQQLDRNRFLTEDRLHVQVTPLSQATLPRICYIVIDKFAEPIVRPLKDFADLGQISGDETQQRTLPVFDNHRVAKRFSNQRTQRVIKVPDSRVFQKTTSHLRAKGIVCLLVDGNIYSLN
ncbi:helix-turn-helix domain-containing protein [Chamaesiphon minutus]|uniref:Transposase n=1 Tax=Chamaesiphon minutus (strain ATCC 27169 / PCC 6605) TaxID=1173020 RepID=K9UKB6_CHAP6|nr:hypothetical protein [Chamaesiphon minutus]AFY95542.1 hypothetical protein Cha6605_4624 [Chamaesiphon minutus PCC 6605]